MTRGYFYLILILISSPTIMAFADSSRVVIPVEEDVFADKSTFYNPKSLSLMTGFGGTKTEFLLQSEQSNQKPKVVSNDVLPITTYLKFDLNTIPSSTLFETVSIDDSKLKLFFTSPDDSDAKLFVFTVSYCANNQWTEENLTWDTRPCMNNFEAIDTMIINEDDIPGFVELDIIGAISKIKEEGKSKITLALDAQPILFDVEYDKSDIGKVTNFIQDNWNNIHRSDFSIDNESLTKETFQGNVDREFNGIWKDYLVKELLNMKYVNVSFTDDKLYSLKYSVTNPHVLFLASSESEQLGHATSPIIIVNYSIAPSVFNDAIIFTVTVILPTLTIVIPVSIWVYKKSKK